MEYARKIRVQASANTIDTFLQKVLMELETEQRPEVLDELLDAAEGEIRFIRASLLGTLAIGTTD